MATPNQRIRKAVFPVAGLGTRFLPATKAMPTRVLGKTVHQQYTDVAVSRVGVRALKQRGGDAFEA